MKEIIGDYVFVSPYHRNRKLLPFRVLRIDPINKEYPLECDTVEYKGHTKEYVTGNWTLESVQEMIDSGYLKRR